MFLEELLLSSLCSDSSERNPESSMAMAESPVGSRLGFFCLTSDPFSAEFKKEHQPYGLPQVYAEAA